MSTGREALDRLLAARRSEREQAEFYSALASAATKAGDDDLATRLESLSTDEEAQQARLTKRLRELGEEPPPLEGPPVRAAVLKGWEADARRLEEAEQRRYGTLLDMELDEETQELVKEILRVERKHAEFLDGRGG